MTGVEVEHAAVDAALAGVLEQIGGQVRSGQAAMARAIAASLTARRHLLVQAGTGTGKSFAYLVPALLHSVQADQVVLVSTATLALQRQLMAKDIPAVLPAVSRALPREPVVALVKGRGNYLCLLRLDESGNSSTPDEPLFELTGRLERQAETVRRWARQTPTGDRDELPEPVDARVWRALSATGRECVGRQRCPVGNQCFAEAARDAAAEADLIVTNHSLLAIDLAGDAAALPPYEVAVLDEAHDLAARLTQASTEVLSEPGIAEASKLAGPMLTGEAVADLSAVGLRFGDAVRTATANSSEALLAELPEDLVRALAVLRDAAHAALTQLSQPGEESTLSRQQAALAAITEVHDRAGLLLGADASLVRWASADPPSLTCAPLTVADRIAGSLLPKATVIGTSATLQVGGTFTALAADWGLRGEGSQSRRPAEATTAEVGAQRSADDANQRGADGVQGSWSHLDVGSPFDYQRQAILYLPRDLPLPGREAISDALLARIGALVRAAGGRTLVLASAWRSVDAIADYLHDAAIPGVEVLVQQRGTPPGPLVSEFAERHEAVLVGTLSLWQGVDVPGPSCSLVILDKIPFPRPDEPVLAARAAAAAAQGRSGFGAVSLPHAGLLLAQGAGRLIRSSADRGVVAILDPRLTQRSYGGYLLKSLPPMWRTSETEVVLAALRRLALA
jgi:ATP-dependent DNA helicase DinG